MIFYTNTYSRGNFVYIRGYHDGKRFMDKIPYKPTFFVPAKQQTQYKTIHGQYVEPIEQGSIREARDFLTKYEDVDGFTIYGSNSFAYTCLNEQHGKDYDVDLIRIANIDIEVASEDGFPDPDLANQEITAITVKYKDTFFVLGTGDFETDRNDVKYLKCSNEKILIQNFINMWEKMDVDIITGWNVQFFDIPYLWNRITRLFDEKAASKLSPYGFAYSRSVRMMNREHTIVDLPGLCVLDYLELYKKFTYSNQESYRLDHIATVELGEKKIDYSEYSSLHQLYKLDYQKFIEYNIKDVELVAKIEDKMKLIEMALALAYDAKVNYDDVFTQVRMWDVLIHNYLIERNIVVPPKTDKRKDAQYAGAYVKDPLVGQHNWVMSFDLNSLYPHLIMQYNISPDTFLSGEYQQVSIDKIIERDIETPDDKVLSASGYYFSRDSQGFLPAMMEMMYNERVIYKKKMLEAESELEEVNRKLKEL